MTAHRNGESLQKHARMLQQRQHQHHKRQRTSDEDDDAATTATAGAGRQPLESSTSTTTRRRATRTSSTEDDEEETSTTSTRRVRTTETTPDALPTNENGLLTSIPLVDAPTTEAVESTPPPAAVSTSSTRSTARAATRTTSTSASASASASGAVDASNLNPSIDANGKSGSNAGAIAGAIIAVLAVLGIAAFFGLRWKRKRAAALAARADGFPASGEGNQRQSTIYHQKIGSYDDMHAGNGMPAAGVYGAAAAGMSGNNNWSEKHEKTEYNQNGYMQGPPSSNPAGNMAGYGTLSATNSYHSNSGSNFAGRGSFASSALSPPSGHPSTFSNGPGYYPSQVPGNNGYPPAQALPSAAAVTMFPVAPSPAVSASKVPLPASPAVTNNSVRTSMLPMPGSQQQQQEQQQGPFADPSTEGKLYVVTKVFEPSMPDELVILPGDKIQIVMTYDDGWCLGCNLSSPARNGGGPPAQGVFPRDCVEEYVSTSPPAQPKQLPRSIEPITEEEEAIENQDIPLATEMNLERAPTLPPLQMSRFSMSSNGPRAESRASTVKAAAPVPEEKRMSQVVEDPYGGVASSASPSTTTFPPNIQIAEPMPSFEAQQAATKRVSVAQPRLSVSDDALLDEFPTTPRTMPSTPNNRDSLAISSGPQQQETMKRSSSLIASKDADLFLALGDAVQHNK